MQIQVIFSDGLVRKLQSMIKGKDSILMLITGRQVHFTADSGEFFKVLTVPVETNEECFVETSTEPLSLIQTGGVLTINIEAEKLNMSYHVLNEETQSLEFDWESDDVVNNFSKYHVRHYLNIINNKQQKAFQTEALVHIKELISACAATESTLDISNGMAVTKNNSIILYQEIIDKDITISFTSNALKEMDKFQLDCRSSVIGSYIVLYRGDYTLAIKKAIENEPYPIPQMYKDDSSANKQVTANMHKLIPLIAKINPKVDSGKTKCVIDIEHQSIEVLKGNRMYSLSMPVLEEVSNNTLKKSKTITIDVVELKSIQRMLSSVKHHELYLYDNNLRIKIKNSNLIIRCTTS